MKFLKSMSEFLQSKAFARMLLTLSLGMLVSDMALAVGGDGSLQGDDPLGNMLCTVMKKMTGVWGFAFTIFGFVGAFLVWHKNPEMDGTMRTFLVAIFGAIGVLGAASIIKMAAGWAGIGFFECK